MADPGGSGCREVGAPSPLSTWSRWLRLCGTRLEKEVAGWIVESPVAKIHCVMQEAGSETGREGT